MAGTEELSASLLQIPAHHDEVGPHRVLGVLSESFEMHAPRFLVARMGF